VWLIDVKTKDYIYDSCITIRSKLMGESQSVDQQQLHFKEHRNRQSKEDKRAVTDWFIANVLFFLSITVNFFYATYLQEICVSFIFLLTLFFSFTLQPNWFI
jgi:hypothetical protein